MEDEEEGTSRRTLLKGGILAGAVGILGWTIGAAGEGATPQGQVGTAANPYEIAYVDTLNYLPRDSDPSDPDDGETWYRGDL